MKLLLFLIVSSAAALDLPSYFPKCRRSDPNLNECMRRAYEIIVPNLVNGIPELNISHILPLRVHLLSIDDGIGPVKVVQHYRNVEFRNLEFSRPESVQASVTAFDFRIVFNVFVSALTMFADYDFDGYVLFLPMVGQGKTTISLLNTTLEIALKGEVVTTERKKYAKVNSVNISLDPKGAEANFTNLFNGDDQLGAEMNHILNSEWRSLYNDVRHGYVVAISEACKSIINQLFTKVSYDELFPL